MDLQERWASDGFIFEVEVDEDAGDLGKGDFKGHPFRGNQWTDEGDLSEIKENSYKGVDLSVVPALRDKSDRYFVRFSTDPEFEQVGLSAYQGRNLRDLVEATYPYYERHGRSGYLLIGRGKMDEGEEWHEGEEITRILGSEYAPVEVRIKVSDFVKTKLKVDLTLAKATLPALPPGFWEEEMRRLALILIPRLTTLALAGMRAGAVKVGLGFNYAIYSVLAAQWAQDYTDQLLKNVRTTNESVVGSILAQWIATPGRTIGDLRAALEPYFGSRRADVIAITEATRALASGEIMAFQRGGVEEIRWGTNHDELVCPLCGPLHGQVRKIGDPFGSFIWRKGTQPEPVFAPPYHPNCRCGVSPVVKLRRLAWADISNSLVIANTMAMISPRYDLAKHDGPGPHDNGSPQDVHGGGVPDEIISELRGLDFF